MLPELPLLALALCCYARGALALPHAHKHGHTGHICAHAATAAAAARSRVITDQTYPFERGAGYPYREPEHTAERPEPQGSPLASAERRQLKRRQWDAARASRPSRTARACCQFLRAAQRA